MNIDKEVPIPKTAGKGRRKYPFGEMLVGDSVFFAGESVSGNPYAAAGNYGKRTGKKFTGRTIDGGLRIWRVE